MPNFIPQKGKWYIETDKNVRMYCVQVSERYVYLSYRPGSAIAVTPTTEDFAIFFKADKIS